MKNYIKEHKLLCIIAVISFIFLIVIIIGIRNIYFKTDGDVYGNRLDDIKNIKVEKETLKKVEDELLATEKVNEVKTRTQGKIIYIQIDYKEDVSMDQAKEIATKTLLQFSDEQKNEYDFSYTLTQKNVEETPFPTMGNKHPKNSTIVWVNQNS